MTKAHLLAERVRAVGSDSGEGSPRLVLEAGEVCRGSALSGDTRDEEPFCGREEEPFYGQPGEPRACGHRGEDWGAEGKGYGQVHWLRGAVLWPELWHC